MTRPPIRGATSGLFRAAGAHPACGFATGHGGRSVLPGHMGPAIFSMRVAQCAFETLGQKIGACRQEPGRDAVQRWRGTAYGIPFDSPRPEASVRLSADVLGSMK